jgi:acyl-CoA dehydrogenase
MISTSFEDRMLGEAADSFFRGWAAAMAGQAVNDGLLRTKWREMADLGWLGMLIDTDHGGTAYGVRGLGQIAEASGRHLVLTPLAHGAGLAAAILAAHPATPALSARMRSLAAGDNIYVAAPQAEAEYRIIPGAAGAPTYVLNGTIDAPDVTGIADEVIFEARPTGQGSDLAFCVPAQSSGVERRLQTMVDGSIRTTMLLHDVHVDRDAALGAPDASAPKLVALADIANVLSAAEMFGAAAETFDRTLAHLTDRRQFGVPIGSFQALQHRAAILACRIELARSCVIAGLDAVEARQESGAQLASLAVAISADVFRQVAKEAVQLHGGLGMTDEHAIGKYLKRSRVIDLAPGGIAFHRSRYARLTLA